MHFHSPLKCQTLIVDVWTQLIFQEVLHHLRQKVKKSRRDDWTDFLCSGLPKILKLVEVSYKLRFIWKFWLILNQIVFGTKSVQGIKSCNHSAPQEVGTFWRGERVYMQFHFSGCYQLGVMNCSLSEIDLAKFKIKIAITPNWEQLLSWYFTGKLRVSIGYSSINLSEFG